MALALLMGNCWSSQSSGTCPDVWMCSLNSNGDVDYDGVAMKVAKSKTVVVKCEVKNRNAFSRLPRPEISQQDLFTNHFLFSVSQTLFTTRNCDSSLLLYPFPSISTVSLYYGNR